MKLLLTWVFALLSYYSYGQSVFNFQFYSGPYTTSLSNVVDGFDANHCITVKNNFSTVNDPELKVEVVHKHLITLDENVVDITDQLPRNIREINIAKSNNVVTLLGVEPQATITASDKIYVGEIKGDFSVDSVTTFDLSRDSSETLKVLYVNTNVLDDSTLLISGNYRIMPFFAAFSFYLEVDRSSYQIKRKSYLQEVHFVRDVASVRDTLYVDDGQTYFLPPDSTEWVFDDNPNGLGFVRWQTDIESTSGSNIYATGQERLVDFRRGCIIVKMNSEFELIAIDSLFLTQDSDSITYPSHQGLIVSAEHNRVISTGTTAIQLLSGGIPFNTELNEIYVSVYDTSLNHIFTKTLGGDAFYYNTFATVIDEHLVLTGLRYLRDDDKLEGYLNITPLDDIVSSKDIVIDSEPLRVFPNPASNFFSITSEDGIQSTDYVLYNLNGQQVQFGRISHGQSIDCSNLPPGTYAIRCLLSDGTIRTGKVIRVGQ